ncbi:MAG: HK97 gp10 family phage protein [Ruminococcaceae bacterium]|nr:HK97 gp10 family phage protein [Oscillospiraceae bacterium]
MSEFTEAADIVHAKALETMAEAMKIIQAETQLICPVKTGTLRRSYQSDARDVDGVICGAVGSNVEYAVWADLKQPHLTRAVEENTQKVQEMFTNALKDGGR